MRLKSYFSPTVEEAIAQARQELGPEAMLVNSRPAPAEARHLGDYEVVFATDLQPDSPEAPRLSAAPPGGGLGERLSLEIAELKKDLAGMRSVLRRSAFPSPRRHDVSQSFAEAYATLVAGEVNPELAREIMEGAESRMGARPAASAGQAAPPPAGAGGALERALAQEIESRFTVEPQLGRSETSPRIVALVGPPGAGKTTTLVKLAVHYGLICRRPLLLLSLDVYRVAAAEQLRSFAAILGVGFQALETVGALNQTIEENRGKELILIDTPGWGGADLEDSMGLGRFLSSRDAIDTHLVLSASTKSADLARIVDAYELFRPRRLLFTRLDETGSFGPILNEAVRTAKPLSFFATGQRIPEDLEAATPSRLTELLLVGRYGAARSAA